MKLESIAYSVSLQRFTCQHGLKYNNIRLQTLQEKDMILLLENIIRGGISSLLGDRYVKSKRKEYCILMLINCMTGQ